VINENIKCRRKLVKELKRLGFHENMSTMYIYMDIPQIIEVRFHYHDKGYYVSLLYYPPAPAPLYSNIEIYNYKNVIKFLNKEFNWFFRKEKIDKLLNDSQGNK
jgi:hypothetical protein